MAALSERLPRSAALWARPSGRPEILGLGIAFCMLLGAVLLRPQFSFAVDLTQVELAPRFEVEGFNALEMTGSQGYRWTTDYPFVQVRHAYQLAPTFRATLTIRSPRPDGPQPVTFMLNERPLATTATTKTLRTYRLVLPNRPDSEGSLRFAASTKNFTPPGDPRRLGFITTGWEIQPQFAIPALGPLRPREIMIVLLGGAVLLLWLTRRLARPAALAVTATLVAGLLGLRQLYQPAPLPFDHLAVIAMIAVAAVPILTRRTSVVIALAIAVLPTTFAGALWPSWMTDDAFISFRYAQNLVSGSGLVYNVGERVEGYTNFLWTMLAALVLALHGDPVGISYYAGVAAALLIVGATFLLARPRIGEGWALAAAALLGSSQSVLIYTSRGSGLETGCFTLLLVAGSALFLDDRFALAGLALALATLTRPEGVLILAIASLIRLLEKRRFDGGLWRMLVAFALAAVPYFAWRLVYYGDLLPNTFYAKTGGGLVQAWRGLLYAGSFGLFAGGPLVILLLGFAALPLVRPRPVAGATSRWLRYCWLVVVLFTAYIVAVGGDHFPGFRFFAPILPFLAVLLAYGLRQALTLLRARPAPAAVLAVIVVAGLCAFNLTRSASFDDVIRGDDESVWAWREIGWWLADHSRPGDSMAALGAGAIPYYSNHPAVDLLGLNDKHIARLAVKNMGGGVAGHEKRDPGYVLSQRRPTYIPALWDDYFGGPLRLQATGLYARQEIVTRFGRRLVLWKRLP